MWGIIIGIIISLLLGGVGIYFLYTVLEMLKIVVLAFVLPFAFLELWYFFRKKFRIDKYISAGLSLVITFFIGLWIYQSWWGIVALGIMVGIGWVLFKIFVPTGLWKDIVKMVREK